jgi:hypothetical protein
MPRVNCFGAGLWPGDPHYPDRVIPDRVRAWAQDHLPAPILAVEPVRGGLTSTIFAVRTSDPAPIILRYVAIDRWGEVGRRHVISEAQGCTLLAGAGLPVPRLDASDPTGAEAGAYANLTTFLPGRPRLDALGPGAIDELARAAVVIHAHPVSHAERPQPYQFWVPGSPQPPDWAGDAATWERAIDIFAAGAPPSPQGLVHRDFHPGNVLWAGDRITGVIDWAETSWGPPDLDVAHSCTNFALLHDFGRMTVFRTAYARHGGVTDPDPEAARFWAISDILGFLPDPMLQTPALIAHRPDLTAAEMRHRLESLLLLTLEPAHR